MRRPPATPSRMCVDRVTVEITNVNNDPVAGAGDDQTVNENSAVALSGASEQRSGQRPADVCLGAGRQPRP